MKVVKRITNGRISYRSIPDFDTGNGIANTVILFGDIETDYEEVEITQEEWDVAVLSGNVEER